VFLALLDILSSSNIYDSNVFGLQTYQYDVSVLVSISKIIIIDISISADCCTTVVCKHALYWKTQDVAKESFCDHGDERLASIAENVWTAVNHELHAMTLAVQ
jgi:hypothetical protein